MLSLEEQALAQVAINLGQDNGFKEIALCLEKPTFGTFIQNGSSTLFISDLTKLPVSTNQALPELHDLDNKKAIKQWEAAVEEHSQRLAERLPYCMKENICTCIYRIAFEYLSFCRRYEILFGISRYFLMNTLNERDWIKAGRLDEEKIAKRFLLDDRLTVLQRYRIACVYSLYADIPQLWKNLTWKEKQLIVRNRGNPRLSKKHDYLVLLWFDYIKKCQHVEAIQQNNQLWYSVVKHAIHYGNLAILMPCWKMLGRYIPQLMIVDIALYCLRKWQATQNKHSGYNEWREKLFSKDMRFKSIECFNLPSYYSELVCFFLSQMHEEIQLHFFKKAFENENCDSVLECFLDWPNQDVFLPLMSRLWKIISKCKYGQCLLTLASKYSRDYDDNRSISLYNKRNDDYDYQSLLWRLWEETPQQFKRYLFRDRYARIIDEIVRDERQNKGKILLPRLLKKTPFKKNDEVLFEQIWCDLLQEERMFIIYSATGEKIYSLLIQKEKLCFMNRLLEACLPKEKILSLKKRFIQSYDGRQLSFHLLRDKREIFLEDLIEWSFELDTEKSEFKYKLVDLDTCKSLLINAEFAEVERMINFCASSNEKKEQLKVSIIKYACSGFLISCEWQQINKILAWSFDTEGEKKDFKKELVNCEGIKACSDLLEWCKWEQMDKILAWSFDTEEEIKNFKKELINYAGISALYNYAFIYKQWEDVEYFYKWFCLSAEEIKQIKTELSLDCQVIDFIEEQLYDDNTDTLVEPLLWCLTNKEMVMNLKKEVEKSCFQHVYCKANRMAKKRLNHLISELLHPFRKKSVNDETINKDIFVQFKGKKRTSIAIEDESSSPRKQLKENI